MNSKKKFLAFLIEVLKLILDFLEKNRIFSRPQVFLGGATRLLFEIYTRFFSVDE